MVSIQVMVAGALDVLGEVDPVVGQRAPDPAQNRQRLGLVVDGVEAGHQVEGAVLRLLVEAAQIPGREVRISVALANRLGVGIVDRLAQTAHTRRTGCSGTGWPTG